MGLQITSPAGVTPPVTLVGSTDAVQLSVRANAVQSQAVQEWRVSNGAVGATIATDGSVTSINALKAGNNTGAVGPGIYGGAGAPAAGLGANGDFFISAAGGAGTTMYQKRAGAWVGII